MWRFLLLVFLGKSTKSNILSDQGYLQPIKHKSRAVTFHVHKTEPINPIRVFTVNINRLYYQQWEWLPVNSDRTSRTGLSNEFEQYTIDNEASTEDIGQFQLKSDPKQCLVSKNDGAFRLNKCDLPTSHFKININGDLLPLNNERLADKCIYIGKASRHLLPLGCRVNLNLSGLSPSGKITLQSDNSKCVYAGLDGRVDVINCDDSMYITENQLFWTFENGRIFLQNNLHAEKNGDNISYCMADLRESGKTSLWLTKDCTDNNSLWGLNYFNTNYGPNEACLTIVDNAIKVTKCYEKLGSYTCPCTNGIGNNNCNKFEHHSTMERCVACLPGLYLFHGRCFLVDDLPPHLRLLHKTQQARGAKLETIIAEKTPGTQEEDSEMSLGQDVLITEENVKIEEQHPFQQVVQDYEGENAVILSTAPINEQSSLMPSDILNNLPADIKEALFLSGISIYNNPDLQNIMNKIKEKSKIQDLLKDDRDISNLLTEKKETFKKANGSKFSSIILGQTEISSPTQTVIEKLQNTGSNEQQKSQPKKMSDIDIDSLVDDILEDAAFLFDEDTHESYEAPFQSAAIQNLKNSNYEATTQKINKHTNSEYAGYKENCNRKSKILSNNFANCNVNDYNKYWDGYEYVKNPCPNPYYWPTKYNTCVDVRDRNKCLVTSLTEVSFVLSGEGVLGIPCGFLFKYVETSWQLPISFTEVEIVGTDIQSVPDAFHGLTNLRTITLTANKIKGLSEKTLNGLNKSTLYDINLAGNDLTNSEISSRFFEGMNNLKFLFLDNNRLEFIDPDWFLGKSSLRQINVNGQRCY